MSQHGQTGIDLVVIESFEHLMRGVGEPLTFPPSTSYRDAM